MPYLEEMTPLLANKGLELSRRAGRNAELEILTPVDLFHVQRACSVVPALFLCSYLVIVIITMNICWNLIVRSHAPCTYEIQ